MMDGAGTPYPNGAIFRYNATTLAASGYFQTSLGGVSGSDGGGIWQGGAGLALGPNKSGANNIYFTTANGVFDANTGGTDYGDSFVELDPTTMTVATNTSGSQLTFTPADQFLRSNYNSCSSTADTDFGSGGVMLIPPHELITPYVAVSGDKEGGIWFMDIDNPSGHATSCDGNCSCGVTSNGNLQAFPILGASGTISPSGPVVHTNPAFWETGTGTNYLFISSEHCCGFTPSGRLLQYTLCPTGQQPINSNCGTGSVSAKASSGSPAVFSYGATPTITQDPLDSTNAVVWAIKADGSVQGGSTAGVLYAFKAVDMSYLYSSDACSGDALLYPATKFSIPTVVSGFAYVAGQGPFNTTQNNWNSGMFYIFGP